MPGEGVSIRWCGHQLPPFRVRYCRTLFSVISEKRLTDKISQYEQWNLIHASDDGILASEVVMS
jgi:hypothetical protein